MYPNQPQPGQFGGSPMYQPQQKGCWGRNWKWIVPTGCLGLILACVAIVAGIFFFVISTVRSSDVYQQALEKAKSNPEVVAELGEPIKEGWLVRGSIESAGGSNAAKLQIPISGPKKSGTIYVEALKGRDTLGGGGWHYSTLEVEVQGRPDRIELLEPTPDIGRQPTSSEDDNANDDTDVSAAPGGDAEDEEPPPPPPPIPPPSGLKVISGGALNGKAVSKPAPVYPPIARAAKASGTVVVQVVVDEEGNVISATAISGHPLLQAAAVAAARQAKFTPTKLSGSPVKVTGTLTYNFVLE
jgi:TonB family protein